jgi:hypothetical protein
VGHWLASPALAGGGGGGGDGGGGGGGGGGDGGGGGGGDGGGGGGGGGGLGRGARALRSLCDPQDVAARSLLRRCYALAGRRAPPEAGPPDVR